MKKTLLPIGVLAFVASATMLPAACTATATFTPPSGVATATWTAPANYGSCTGNEYIVVSDPTLCAGCTTTAYAYCDGSSYSQCSCDAPAAGSGWNETTIAFTPPSGVVTVTWTVPADYGSCTGSEYVVISDPTLCTGCTTTAYAYCDGSSYSECSCDAPAAGSSWTETTITLSEAGTDTGGNVDGANDSGGSADAGVDSGSSTDTDSGAADGGTG